MFSSQDKVTHCIFQQYPVGQRSECLAVDWDLASPLPRRQGAKAASECQASGKK